MASAAEIDAWVGDDPLRRRAREWVDRVNAATGLSGGWRLQVMSLRSRRRFAPSLSPDLESGSESESESEDLVAADGSRVYSPAPQSPSAGCPELPARLRRFVSGCPWPIVDQVIRYLYASAPYEGIVFNGVRSEGVYRPTRTDLTRDAQAQVGADATYTIVQDLVEVSACRDEEVVETGGSCLQSESTVFRWDEPYVEGPDRLGPCAQGETVSVQAARRNDDGTFDYQVVRTYARTRHVPAHAVACDAAHSATEERWENLYGSPGSWRAENACGAVPLSGLPAASCESLAAGVRTSWEVQLNRDCTYSVSRRVVRANRVGSSWTDGTPCQEAAHEEVRGDPRPPKPAPLSAGRRVDMRVQVEDDGSYSWSRTVREAPPEDAVTWGDGSPCRPRTVTHAMDVRSRKAALSYVPKRVAGRVVDAQVSRNEDCTWDVRVAVTDSPARESVSWSDGSPCRPREHVREMNVPDKAAAVAAVHPRAAGYAVDAQVSRNEDCTWDVVSSRAKTSPEWSAAWTDGSSCRPRENFSGAGFASLEAARGHVHARGSGTVQADIRMDDDCTWRVSSSRTARQSAWSRSWTEGSSVAPVSRAVWQSQASVPAAAVAAPGARQVVSASLRRNEDCTYDASREVRTRQAGSATWCEGSACRPTTTTAMWAQASYTTAAPAAGQTVSMSVQRNDDGTYDERRSVTTRKSVPDASWTEGSACRPVRVVQGWGRLSVPSVSAGVGEMVSMSVQRNDDCTYDFRRSVRSRADSPDITWTDGAPGVSVARHTVSEGRPSPPSVSMTPGAVTRASVRRDEDCTYSSEVTVTSSVAASASWIEGSSCRPVVARAGWGLPSMPPVPHPAAGHEVSASVQRNADGTYDATVRDRFPETGSSASWTHGSPARRVTSRAYSGVVSVPSPGPGSPGTFVSASFSRSSDCTYSGRVDTSISTPWSYGYQTGAACALVANTVYDHYASPPQVPSPAVGETVSASVSREDDGTYSARTSVARYDQRDNIYYSEWDSTETGPDHKYTYHTTLHLFSHARQVPQIPKDSHVNVNIRMEDDCTFSGSISSTKLKSWERNVSGGSGGGQSGGGYTRTEYMVSPGGVVLKREIKYRTRWYSGSPLPSASMLSGYDEVKSAGGCIVGVTCMNPEADWTAISA